VDIKGVHTVIEALPRVAREMPGLDIKLTILGDTTDTGYLDRLKVMIAAARLEGAVSFLPAVPESDLFQCFQEHDIYLFPSLYEPFSLTLIHALAAGIPTVSSDAGGNVDIVRDGENGLLVPADDVRQLADAVGRLLRDAALRGRLGARARDTALGYTFEGMIEKLERYLQGNRR
jgi:glycosyltransferase involved in cell wall biosynthesis